MSGKIEKNEAGVGKTQNENDWAGYIQYDDKDIESVLNTDFVPTKSQYFHDNLVLDNSLKGMFTYKDGAGRVQYRVDVGIPLWAKNMLDAGKIALEEVDQLRFGFISDVYTKNNGLNIQSTKGLVDFASGTVFTRVRGVDYLVCRHNHKTGRPTAFKWFEADSSHLMRPVDWYDIGYDDDFAQKYNRPEWAVPEDQSIMNHSVMQYCKVIGFNYRGSHDRPTPALLNIFEKLVGLAKPSRETTECQLYIDRLRADPEGLASPGELEEAGAIASADPRESVQNKQAMDDIRAFLNRNR